jgi:myo-inositol 2-dehydrogenase/D-chiro-inositol 1-dehydrogenase
LERSNQVQLALIGAGRMGRMHLQALAESDTVRIVAIVDPVEPARAAAAEIDPRPSGYAELDDALENPIDGVLIAAPTPLHERLVSACAQRGLPVLCEKPCGSSTAELDAAVAAADAAAIKLQVGYWRRYVPELSRLRERIANTEFGALLQVTCWQWDGEPPGAVFRSASGGIAIDMGVHELDQTRWLTGSELSTPTGVSTAGAVGGDVDCAAITFELAGGGAAVVSLGRYFSHGDCVWVDIMGTRDSARVDVLWGEDKTWHPALRAQAEDFARAIRTGEEGSGASAADARRALELAALSQAEINAAIAAGGAAAA